MTPTRRPHSAGAVGISAFTLCIVLTPTPRVLATFSLTARRPQPRSVALVAPPDSMRPAIGRPQSFQPDGSRKPLRIEPRQTIDLNGSSGLQSTGPEINTFPDESAGPLPHGAELAPPSTCGSQQPTKSQICNTTASAATLPTPVSTSSRTTATWPCQAVVKAALSSTP